MGKKIRLLLLLVLLLGVCNTPFSQNLQNSKSIIKSASEPDYHPFSFINESNEPQGFSIDLFNAATNAVGIKVSYKVGVWSKIKQDLSSGDLEALPFVGRTPEREKTFDFSIPYLTFHGGIFVRTNTNNIKSLEDLKNKSVLVMKGDTSEEIAREENLSEYIFATNTLSNAFEELSAGHHDAVITHRLTGLNLLNELEIENIVSNMQVGLYVYKLVDDSDDSSLTLKYLNPASEKITGLAEKEIINEKIDTIFPSLRQFNIPSKYKDVIKSQKGII